MEIKDYVINTADEDDLIMAVVEKYTTNPAEISDIEFQKAKRLLNSFQHVLWTIDSNIKELDEECKAVMNEELAYAVEILDKFDYRMDAGKLEGRLAANQETRLMAKLIVTAILKVKEYPLLGENYFKVLQKTYLSKDKHRETDILYELAISRSTYYKYKKDAVKVFGYCLWQIIIPNMKKAKSTENGQLLCVAGYVG
ncbi:DUF1492 domain-containing protein [Konateibacter massiliensis]|uniref:DUF1492 domain-containing protein n=1 Tax=Konateibacter massiliensis TaxID=2002841 RepID=UPI000C14DFA0|nr:DUF1492 domain-containing protein [Konateibacter massiliensis]